MAAPTPVEQPSPAPLPPGAPGQPGENSSPVPGEGESNANGQRLDSIENALTRFAQVINTQGAQLNRLSEQLTALQNTPRDRNDNPAPEPTPEPVPAPAPVEEIEDTDQLIPEKDLKALIGGEYIASEKVYKTAMERQTKDRKRVLEKLWTKAKMVGKIAMPLAAAYAGVNIWEGHSIAEAISGLSNVAEIAVSPVKYGADQIGDLFNIPERNIVIGGAHPSDTIAKGGPFYKFFKSIFGKDAAYSATKAIGSLGTSIIGHNVVAQSVTYLSVPVWGATIAPIIGSGLAVWGANKAYKFAKNAYGKYFKVNALQRQEKSNYKFKQNELLEKGEDEKAAKVGVAINQIPRKVAEIRSGVSEAEKTTNRKRSLQRALAIR